MLSTQGGRRSTRNFKLFIKAGVGYQHFEHEAILLCFGKGIGPFLFNGILCCQTQRKGQTTDVVRGRL